MFLKLDICIKNMSSLLWFISLNLEFYYYINDQIKLQIFRVGRVLTKRPVINYEHLSNFPCQGRKVQALIGKPHGNLYHFLDVCWSDTTNSNYKLLFAQLSDGITKQTLAGSFGLLKVLVLQWKSHECFLINICMFETFHIFKNDTKIL